MAVTDMTLHDIQDTIAKNETVLIDFWAPWCGPCKRFGPIFETTALKHPDLKFVKVNTEDQPDLAAQFGVMSIPTLGIFKDKELIFLQPGALPEEVLEEVIAKVREVDMNDVRKKVSAGEPLDEDEPE